MRSLSDWMRLGSEAESEDLADGFPARGGAMSDEEIREGLRAYFAEDLANPEICEHEETALDALVDGYRNGG